MIQLPNVTLIAVATVAVEKGKSFVTYPQIATQRPC